MATPVIQTSFHAGEWAPELNARVDLAKYHAAAALLRNYFVDYRGGASTRTGTRYVLQAFKSSTAVRLIPFQASLTTNYVLEFGDGYVRFFSNGAAILTASGPITAITQANPAVVSVANSASIGDWIFIADVAGMTQVNGRYFRVNARTAGTITLGDLNGVNINSTAYTAYVSGGTVARVYTLASPYLAADLALLKFTQNVNTLTICHPSYVPYVLTLISAASWTLTPIVFGTTISPPTGTGAATTAGGIMQYSYVLTSVDTNNQESIVSAIASSTVTNAAGNQSITVSWTAATGALSYNIYRAGPSAAGVVPVGSAFGFLTNVTGVSHADTFTNGIPIYPADFTSTIPIAKNPFQGAGIASIAITNAGTYTTVPSATFGAAPVGGTTATGNPVLSIIGTPTINTSFNGQLVGDILDGQFITCSVVVATINVDGAVLTVQPITFPGSNPGSILSGPTPTNPVNFINRRTQSPSSTINLVWGVSSVQLINPGAGYTSAPAITFSAGAAAATATLASTTAGNPIAPIFFDQRLVLAGQATNPQRFDMSQPGSYYNFNISNPLQPDDAITGTLVSSKLNNIQSMIVMSAGLIILSDQQAWLVNGGAAGAPPTAIDTAANSQAYNGSSPVPPIVANLDILYVQAKGYTIRSLTFNFYTNIYTGTDISVLSSHLFYGFTINEWAYCEEPFKLVWAVRSDGILLSLTYLKEQELIGWAHSDTNGQFKSVCSVTEQTSFGSVDALYTVVQRTINGNVVQYVERMAERIFPYGVEDSFAVDAALQTVPLTRASSTLTVSQLTVGAGATFTTSAAVGVGVGAVFRVGGGIATVTAVVTPSFVFTCTITQAITAIPNVAPAVFATTEWTIWGSSTSFTGAEHLAGATVTGLADGAIIPPFVMPTSGFFTLAAAASKVVVGLAFTPQLQTLQLDVGQPTVQGKRKKIVGVSVRCKDTLGLNIGRTLDTSSQVAMKDLVVGNLGSQTNELVTNEMLTGDAWTVLDSTWDVPGQYFITQPNPFPASILGVIPDIVVGDT